LGVLQFRNRSSWLAETSLAVHLSVLWQILALPPAHTMGWTTTTETHNNMLASHNESTTSDIDAQQLI
jgi:hypothetical protein